MEIEHIIFWAVTCLLVWFSWYASLKEKRYHGIFRFFAFESILLIVILNYKVWFADPFSIFQIGSWFLLIASALLAILGFGYLSSKGKAKGKFENTTKLISSGVYRRIRHPMYLSLLMLGFGAMLKQPGILTGVLSFINFISIYFTARVEEKEMIERFGDEYRQYMKQSKMFIPFIF